MHKYQVLQIIRSLDIGGSSGGAERFGLALSRSLNQDGHRVFVCAFFKVNSETERAWQARLQEEGIETCFAVDWAGNENLPQYLHGLNSLFRRLRGRKFDIAQAHFPLGSLTAILLKLAGKARAAIRTAHLKHEWNTGRIGWLLNLVFIRFLFPLGFDAEVGVSQDIVDTLKSLPGTRLFKRSPRLIHNAVSYQASPEPALAPEMLPRRPGDRLVLSAGRLTEQKGYPYLLKAIPAILSAVPGARFYIAGDGELNASLQSMAKELGIQDSVVFMGMRTDLPFLFPQFDLFVLPSLWEGFPTVIMESMVSGVPVIATDIPGTRELIEHGKTGWLVPPRDPESLALAVTNALLHPTERETIAHQAQQAVQQYFIENICQEYLELYERLLKH